MTKFGKLVKELIELYSECLAMVKRLSSNGGKRLATKPGSVLRRQLRADRDNIQAFYQSRLRHSGTSFESGDGILHVASLTEMLNKERLIV